MKKRIVVLLAVVVAVAIGGLWYFMSGDVQPAGAPEHKASEPGRTKSAMIAEESPNAPAAARVDDQVAASDDDAEEEDELTDEEKAAAEEESKVEAFDALTDKWTEDEKATVKMEDVDAFVAAFRRVPKDRQDECVHRALNLIPDENVMLLAGILMDKSIDKEIVEDVFNDILNRDEDVKMPILQQVFKDKTHACWADVAWILDVTGELQEKKK